MRVPYRKIVSASIPHLSGRFDFEQVERKARELHPEWAAVIERAQISQALINMARKGELTESRKAKRNFYCKPEDTERLGISARMKRVLALRAAIEGCHSRAAAPPPTD